MNFTDKVFKLIFVDKIRFICQLLLNRIVLIDIFVLNFVKSSLLLNCLTLYLATKGLKWSQFMKKNILNILLWVLIIVNFYRFVIYINIFFPIRSL